MPRSTDSFIEAFDISAAATGTIAVLGRTAVTLSSTGVGLDLPLTGGSTAPVKGAVSTN